MNQEKQLEKLQSVISLLETDRASTDEVAQALEAIMLVMKNLKSTIDRDMAFNKGQMDDLFAGVMKQVKVVEQRIEKVSTRLEEKMAGDNSSIRAELVKEVKSLRALIPQLPDLSYLEKKIEAVAKNIPLKTDLRPLEKKMTGLENDVRNVEDEIDELKRKPLGSNSTTIFGINQYGADQRYSKFHGGASNITVSTTAPLNPLLNDVWIDNS